MTRLPPSRLFFAATMLIVVLAVTSSFAQQPARPAKFEFQGVQRCADCHHEPSPLRVEAGVTKFVALTESQVWLKEDKHALAFKRIDPATSPLARQMCEALGITDIHQAKECLSCHANWQYHREANRWDERPLDYKLGVTCESCHGPSSAWEIPHTKVEWRRKTPAEKLELGMVEVRNPTARARQCLACHIGDAAQGKQITHAMYAAGHPPLPGVELETFIREMPPHWRHLDEKPEFELRDEFVAANPAATAGGKLHRSHGAMLSAVVAMQISLDLMTSSTQDAAAIPDFAVFDCYACHHDLKSPSWRQQRREAGVPGRPRPAVWPQALVEGAIVLAEADATDKVDAWRAALAEHHAAFDARPFGHREKLVSAKQSLAAQLDELAATLENASSDAAAVEQAMRHLCTSPGVQTIDYDTARQLAWALDVLSGDLGPHSKTAAQVQAFLTQWREPLHLALPSKQSAEITADLPQRLKALSAYDPAGLHKDLESLRTALEK